MKEKLSSIFTIFTRLTADLPIFYMFFFLHFQREGSGNTYDAAFNAALFIVWAVVHSILARNTIKKFIANLVGEDYVKPLYCIIAGITFSLVLLLWRPLVGVLWQTSGVLYWGITILYIGCIAGTFYAAHFIDWQEFLGIKRIKRARKNIKENPAQTLSTKGLYAHCRHPIYLFMVLAFWVGPVMTYSRLQFALLGTLYFIIGGFFEERNLREELGEAYRLYQKNVPMWIPRIKPWHYHENESQGVQK